MIWKGNVFFSVYILLITSEFQHFPICLFTNYQLSLHLFFFFYHISDLMFSYEFLWALTNELTLSYKYFLDVFLFYTFFLWCKILYFLQLNLLILFFVTFPTPLEFKALPCFHINIKYASFTLISGNTDMVWFCLNKFWNYIHDSISFLKRQIRVHNMLMGRKRRDITTILHITW